MLEKDTKKDQFKKRHFIVIFSNQKSPESFSQCLILFVREPLPLFAHAILFDIFIIRPSLDLTILIQIDIDKAYFGNTGIWQMTPGSGQVSPDFKILPASNLGFHFQVLTTRTLENLTF